MCRSDLRFIKPEINEDREISVKKEPQTSTDNDADEEPITEAPKFFCRKGQVDGRRFTTHQPEPLSRWRLNTNRSSP